TYLEKWTAHIQPPHNVNKAGAYPIGRPVVGGVTADGEYRGVLPDVRAIDDVLVKTAIALGVPNFGKDGGGPGKDINHIQDHMNVILDGGDFSGGIDPNSKHMQMGGLFKNPGKRYTDDGKHMATGPKGGLIHLYGVMGGREIASYKNAMTGEYYDAIPQPMRRIFDNKGNEIDLSADYPYELITYKEWQHTQSRTASNLWLMSNRPENGLEMNPSDARKEGVSTGDWVEVEGPGGSAKMKVIVTNRIRPGIFAVSQSFGHWELGSRPYDVDGKPSASDARIGAGFTMNWLAMADPSLPGDANKNPTIGDWMCGSIHQYGHPCKIRKVTV
ncbi:MAG: molybdopterin dinucleotide binding domain-containing protein, partial [Candidatus Hydrothermarchaeaceae archaeon]